MLRSACHLKCFCDWGGNHPAFSALFFLVLSLVFLGGGVSFFLPHFEVIFFLSMCWRYQNTQKEPCPGNSPKVSRGFISHCAFSPSWETTDPHRPSAWSTQGHECPRGLPHFSFSRITCCQLSFFHATNQHKVLFLAVPSLQIKSLLGHPEGFFFCSFFLIHTGDSMAWDAPNAS